MSCTGIHSEFASGHQYESPLPESQSVRVPGYDVEQCQTTLEAMNLQSDPMRCLPIEILSHIFNLCLPYRPPPSIDDTPLRTRWEVDVHPVPFRLGSTCRYWRQVAWSTPQLWNTLHLHVSGSARGNLVRNRLLDEWLRRSGQLPLYISVFCIGRDYMPLQSEDTDAWNSITWIIETLMQDACRWRLLDADLPRFYVPFLLHGSRSAHNLETLSIATTRHLEWPSNLRTPSGVATSESNKSSPKYVKLRIPRIREIHELHWSEICHLQLGKPNFQLVVGILRLTPVLESLKLNHCHIGSATAHGLPSTPITLNSLHTFRLYWTPISFFRFICCPNLKNIHYLANSNSISDPGFLNRSLCPLTVLTITVHDYDLDNLKTLFRAAATLTQLKLSYRSGGGFPSENFFTIFGSPSTSGNEAVILPNLRELHLFDCIRDFKWPPVQSLIALRPLSNMDVRLGRDDADGNDATITDPVLDFETLTEVLRAMDNAIKINITDWRSRDVIQLSREFHSLWEGGA